MDINKTNDIRKNSLFILISAVLVLIASTNFLPPNISLFLFAIAIALCGYDFAIKSIENLLSLKFDEKLLITITVMGSFVLRKYMEAAIITILFNFGIVLKDIMIGYLEERSKNVPYDTQKGKTEKLIIKYSKYYMIFAVVVAVIFFVASFIVTKKIDDTRIDFIYRALVILAIASESALFISIPLLYKTVSSVMDDAGVKLLNINVFAKLAKLHTIVFNKTGVLTTGTLSVGEIKTNGDYTSEQVLKLAATAEAQSDTKIGIAICGAADNPKTSAGEFSEIKGLGVTFATDGKEIICGSSALMKQYNIDVSSLPDVAVYVAVDGVAVGSIKIHDILRPEAAQTIKDLKADGTTKTVMLTSDNKTTATAVKEKTLIKTFFAALSAREKLAEFLKLKKKGNIAFVGDSDDKEILGCADVAITMEHEAEDETVDIILTGGSLAGLPRLIATAKVAVSVLQMNIIIAIVIKAVVLIMGTLGFVPIWLAIAADFAISMITLVNINRILKK